MAEPLTITICGDGGCGKSSLTLRVVRGSWTASGDDDDDYDPTIEDSYTVSRTVEGRGYAVQLTDTAGQEEYRALCFGGGGAAVAADGFLLVYSIASRASLAALEDVWARLVRDECANRAEQRRCWPAVMVVGNKCDLGRERQVSASEGLEWARRRGWGFMETSAREFVNVEETFSALIRRVVEAKRMHAAGQTQPVVDSPMMGSHGADWSEKTSPATKQGPSRNEARPKRRGLWSRLSCC